MRRQWEGFQAKNQPFRPWLRALMKRTFAVASRRACLRVVLIAWPPSTPRPSPSLALPRPFKPPLDSPRFASSSYVSQLAAISHSSTNWITLSCERPMVTAANTRAARWRSEDESSLRGGIFWDAIRFRWPCFREENSLPNFLGEKFWGTIFFHDFSFGFRREIILFDRVILKYKVD